MISIDAYNAIAALDLDRIKMKLMHQSGEQWSQEKADAVEVEYRRFLYLCKVYPEQQISPLVEVDIFWHFHILDTMKYAQDCEQAFGYFMHHQQYLGMEGTEEDTSEHNESIDLLRDLYEATFNEAYGSNPVAFGGADNAAFCGRAESGINAAFCGRAEGELKAAFCGRAEGKPTAAFCGRAEGELKAAFCGRAEGKPKAAFCGRAEGELKAAFCGRAEGGLKAAFCGRAEGKPKAAFCGRAEGGLKAAFCGRAEGGLKAAFCGRAEGKPKAAFCGRAETELKAAFCGRAESKPKAAFCGRAEDKPKAAFCGQPGVQAKAAFCGKAAPRLTAASDTMPAGMRAGMRADIVLNDEKTSRPASGDGVMSVMPPAPSHRAALALAA